MYSSGRERGLLLILCRAEGAESCRLQEKSTQGIRSQEVQKQDSHVSVVVKSFLGSRNNASICCNSESC